MKEPSERLQQLLEAAKDYVMTPEEKRAQAISWVSGELMLQYPDMTAEEAERRAREAVDSRSAP